MQNDSPSISVEVTVHAPMEKVWEFWTEPRHIEQWNAASADWHTTSASNDLRVGGTFRSRMEAKDKSAGFDFSGTYTEIIPWERIAYTLGDGRKVEVTLQEVDGDVKIKETFEIEHTNAAELQKNGWQAILNEFKRYTEKT